MTTADQDELYNELLRCNKCGFCQANCPTYNEVGDESACARGRLRLFRAVMDGKQLPTDTYGKRLDRCTGCMACSIACPSGAQPHRLIMAARAHFVANRGLPGLKSFALRDILADERRHGMAFALASRAQRLRLLELTPEALVPAGIDLKSFPLASQAFRDTIPEVNPAPAGQERVAFFVGCMIDHSLPNIGRATLRVLHHLGVDVVVPKGLKCCGLPLIMSGEREAAVLLAEHNLHRLSQLQVDHIVTACASCGNALKNEYPELLKKTPSADQSKRVAEMTVDICAFLPSRLPRADLGELNQQVTYHDPCHLVRGQGIAAEPRQLLRSIPRLEFVEMNEADRCCGAGGTFQVFFPAIAQGITKRKLDNVRATGADTVLTACPACIQRLQGGLHQAGMPQSAKHVIELIDQALVARNNDHDHGQALDQECSAKTAVD